MHSLNMLSLQGGFVLQPHTARHFRPTPTTTAAPAAMERAPPWRQSLEHAFILGAAPASITSLASNQKIRAIALPSLFRYIP